MTMLFKTIPASIALLLASAASASAQDRGWWASFWESVFVRIRYSHQTPAHNVPEIDAASGVLAVAAVLAALTLVWEIRRRRG